MDRASRADLQPGAPGDRAVEAPVDVDLTAAAGAAAAEVPPEILAQSLGEYLRGWWQQLRSGESGVLPVLVGDGRRRPSSSRSSPRRTPSCGPATSSTSSGRAPSTWCWPWRRSSVLLLGEIDLSIGAVALLGGTIAYKLVQKPVAELAVVGWRSSPALVCCGVIGALQGTLVARLRIPAFVVTLAGQLLFTGIAGRRAWAAPTASLSVSPTAANQSVLYNLVQGTIDPVVSWVIHGGGGGGGRRVIWLRAAGRRRGPGWSPRRASLTAIKIALMAAVGVAVLLDLQRQPGRRLRHHRGRSLGDPDGARACWGSGPCCSGAPASAATSTRSAATPRRRAGPASSWP